MKLVKGGSLNSQPGSGATGASERRQSTSIMPTTKRSASSIPDIRFARKLSEWFQMFGALLRDRSPLKVRDYSWLRDEVEAYDAYAKSFLHRPIVDCRILEIGFGARPYRLLALHAAGCDVLGVDLDMPALRVRDLASVFRANGWERALKTAVRLFIFDIAENRQLRRFLASESGRIVQWPIERLVVSNAADPVFWSDHPGRYDFIFSEDVFEHIPGEELRRLLAEIAAHLSHEGIALVRPLIWTGIQGGHHVEFYGYRPGGPRPTVPPWDHLRGRTVPANTYLNELTRREYVAMFKEYFDILEEREWDPDLGRDLLTPELRSELSRFDEYELLSNRVAFVLRRKRPMSAACVQQE
jgi:hypothetical protein